MKFYNYLIIGTIICCIGILLPGCGGGGGEGSDEESSPRRILQIDERGGEWTLTNGAKITIPSTSVSDTTQIDFKKIQKPEELKEDAVVYTFTSDRNVREASFVLPIELDKVKEKSDLVVLYERERDGAIKTVDFKYDELNRSVSFTLNDNHLFQYIPEKAKEVQKKKDSINVSLKDNLLSDYRSNILIVRIVQEMGLFPRKKEPLAMPFFSQMDGTCWAAVGKMVQTSLYPAGESPEEQIYSFMKKLNIGIAEGLPVGKSESYRNFIALNSIEYETFRLDNNAKSRIIQILNMNRPVIFRRNGHMVLVIGFEESSEGTYIIQHNPQFNETGMYQKILYKESFPENGLEWGVYKLDRIELMWSRNEPDEKRALQTVEIPDSGSDFAIYFSGAKTSSLGSIRIALYFDPNAPRGYLWKKKMGQGTYTGGAFPNNVENCTIELPVWNTDRNNGANLKLVVTLREMDDISNKIINEENFNMEPLSFVRKEFKFDLMKLREKIDSNKEFEITVELYNETKLLSDISLNGILLQPITEKKEIKLKDIWSLFPDPQYCEKKVDDKKAYFIVYLNPDNDPSNGDYIKCEYEYGNLVVEQPVAMNKTDGIAKVYMSNGVLIEYAHYKNGEPNGEHVIFYRDGSVRKIDVWENGEITTQIVKEGEKYICVKGNCEEWL